MPSKNCFAILVGFTLRYEHFPIYKKTSLTCSLKKFIYSTFKTVYRLQISLCIITSSRCFLQPAFRFFWISLRPISDSQLHALPHFHLCPIYLIVSKGSYVIPHGISHLKGGFTLRCLQRLSLPNLATRLCHWCDNR